MFSVFPGPPGQTGLIQRAAQALPPATVLPSSAPPPSPQPSRPQQGQVKLTMAQLLQLTQGAQVRCPPPSAQPPHPQKSKPP